MKNKTMKQAVASIRMATRTVKGRKYESWECYLGVDRTGKRIRIVRNTREGVENAVREWYRQSSALPLSSAFLTPSRLNEAVLAFSILDEKGITTPLNVIVGEWLARNGAKMVRKPLVEAYNEYLGRFNASQTVQVSKVKSHVGRFVAMFPTKTVDQITSADLVAYLDALGDIAPKTYNSNLSYNKTFFTWCSRKARGWCQPDIFDGLDMRTKAASLPEAASVEDVRAMFAYLLSSDSKYRDFLLYRETMSCFTGMRQDEISRLDPSDIRLEDGSVLVRDPKGSQSGRISHRTFTLHPTAVAWLAEVDMEKVTPFLKVTAQSLCRIFRRLKDELNGHSYPDNFGRHSFISYHVALYNDITRTASMVGNSPAIIRDHYQKLYTKAEGEAYFAITPDSIRSTSPVTAA